MTKERWGSDGGSVEPVTFFKAAGVSVAVRTEKGQIRIDVDAGLVRLLPDGVGIVVEPDVEPEDTVPVRLALLAHRGTRRLRPGETELRAIRTPTAWVAKTTGSAPRWIAARTTLSALQAWAARAGVELVAESSPNVGDPERDKLPGEAS